MTHRLSPLFAAELPARCVLIVVLLLAAQPGRADERDGHTSWTTSGDALQWGIPVLGLGLTFLFDNTFASDSFDPASGLNWPGPRLQDSPRHDFVVSFLRKETMTYTLKYAVDAKRPNGGSQSFPSGHTSAAFMGAEFIRKEYGPWWGAPAYIAASWVSYTRVDAHQHYWRDVLGGAAVGIASNYDFDSVETPLGELYFGPALFDSELSGLAAQDDTSGRPVGEAARPVPGLRVELRF